MKTGRVKYISVMKSSMELFMVSLKIYMKSEIK